MANDLVVQVGARLDQFQKDMDQAGAIADQSVSRIESSFSKLNPGISLTSLTAFGAGAAAALGGALAALKSISAEMAEIAKNAEYAGVSVERFQELTFAAQKGGVSSQEAVAGLRNMSKLLSDAKENENSLTRLLDANNVKYKDRNGDVIKLNQALTITIDLINKFRSLPEKVEAAKMAGLTEDWVQAIRQGGAAFNELAAKAQDAGAVIDKQTIARAQEFDAAWNRSINSFSMQFKSALINVGSWFSELIQKAVDFSTTIDQSPIGEKIRQAAEEARKLSDAMQVVNASQLGMAQDVAQLDRVLASQRAKANPDPEIIANLEAARAKAVELAAELNEVAKAASLAGLGQAMTSFPGGKVPLPGARPADADRPKSTDARLPGRGAKAVSEETDALAKQSEQIEKRMALMEADTKVMGQGIAKQEEAKVMTQLLTAAEKDKITVDAEMRLAMEVQAEQAGKVAQAHAEAAYRMQQLNAASQQIGSALSSAFSDAILEGKALNDVLSSLLKTMAKMVLNAAVMAPFQSGAGGGLSPFASMFSGLFSGGGGTGVGGIGHAAGGTNYAAGGMTLVGEKGPELVNLPRGAQVIPNDVLQGGSGGSIVYSPAIDARGASVDAVARLAQIMEADRASFATRTVQTIQQARRGRVPGL